MEPFGLVEAATVMQTVLVLVEGAVVLTVDAPPSVTVGDTFMVTVGVDQETPLPEGTAVTATVSFAAGTADSTEQVVVLTPAPGMPQHTLMFTAPVTAGIFAVAAMGATEDDTAILLLIDASAQVTVEPVAVVVQLSGPETVPVGETYTVRVDTDMPVPEGTTLEVTLSDGIGMDPEFVTLTGEQQSMSQSFTAPGSAGPVVITATVMARTSSGSLQVAVAEQVTLTVMVEAVQISLQLQLEAVPAEVTARTSFAVTVVAEPEVPAGTTVTVTVSFDGTDGSPVASSPVALSSGTTSAAVMLTAPGRLVEALVLTASGDVEDAAPAMQQVTVVEATTSVAVVPQSVQLTLAVPSGRVNFNSQVAVTVGVSPPLLDATTLTVEV